MSAENLMNGLTTYADAQELTALADESPIIWTDTSTVVSVSAPTRTITY
jgi:hypothetical protein